jgi:hypothetical protein
MKRWFLTVGALLLAAQVSAQEVPSLGLFLVPKIGTGIIHDAFRPKYFTAEGVTPALVDVVWSGMDYGLENMILVSAQVTSTDRTTLSAQVDVLAVPATLDAQISGAALPTIQSKLEAMNIPGNWVTTALTYRQAVRTVMKVIQVMQRFNGVFPGLRVFGGGITLDTQWNQLTQAQRDRIKGTADTFGIDYSAVTNTMTLRQILVLLSDQLPPLTVMGEVF